MQEVHIYGDIDHDKKALVIFSNFRENNPATFNFGGLSYIVPKWTVEFLTKSEDGSLKVLFSSSGISNNVSLTTTLDRRNPKFTDLRYQISNQTRVFWIPETLGIWESNRSKTSPAPLEQLSLTKDRTDYLWYTRSDLEFKTDDVKPIIVSLKSVTDVWYVWVDNVLANPGLLSVSPSLEKPFDVSCKYI